MVERMKAYGEDVSIKDMYAEWNDDLAHLSLLRNEMKEDDDFYLGNQWGSVKKKKGKPYLSINLIKKRVDWVSGFHRQNRNGMKTYPHEGSDDFRSDVYTQLLQLMYSSRPVSYQLDATVDDAIKCGIGWFFVYMDYSRDILNGDIVIRREDPFRVLFDPYMNSPDLSDCSHIFRRAYLSKTELKAMYPKLAKEIEGLPDQEENALENMTARSFGGKGRVNVLEKWYRDSEERPFAINLQTMEHIILDKGGEQKFLESLENPEDYKIVNRRANIIKMKRSIGDFIMAYDGVSPYLEDEYPLIPVMWTFDPTCPDWEWKLQGMVRPLRDIQLEKNKRRSQMMEFILSKNIKGYKVKRGANVDMKAFLTGDEQVVEMDDLNDIDQFDGPKIPDAYVMLEKENNTDFDMVSIPSDMLGVPDTGQQAVGVAQLRERANYTQIQHGLDNIWLGYEMLSKHVIKLVNKHWDIAKIKNIVGENTPHVKELKELEKQAIEIQSTPPPQDDPQAQAEFVQQGEQIMQQLQNLQQKIAEYWDDFDKGRANIDWDVRFGDLQDTPSYRLANLATINEWKHQGNPVPDEIALEFMDIDKKTKERWLEIVAETSQSQQQSEQMAMQFEQMMEQMKAQVKIEVAKIAAQAQIGVATIKANDVYESELRIQRDNVNLGDNKMG